MSGRFMGGLIKAADLATTGAGKGAEMVAYAPAGAGAVATNVQTKLREFVSPEDYGAVGNGVNDDTAACVSAAAHALSSGLALRADKHYLLTATLNLRSIAVDALNAQFTISHAGIGILLGGVSNVAYNPAQSLGRVLRSGGATSTPTIRVMGTKGSVITVHYTDYFQLWASTTAPDNAINNSIAYSSFYLPFCTKLELNNDPANAGGPFNANAGGSVQWINENRFYLNRTQELIVDGTYDHNHNIFHDGNFENTAVINFNRGANNQVLNTRFEVQGGATAISFGPTTWNNRVISSYDENEYAGLDTGTTPGSSTVTDLGLFGNLVRDEFRNNYRTETVAYADISQVVLNNQTGFATSSRAPQLQRVFSSSNGVVLVESEFLPVAAGDYYRYVADLADSGDTVRYRAYITFWDKNLQQLVPLSSWIVSNNITTVAANRIAQSTGYSEGYARVTSAAVAAGAVFCKVGWITSNAQTANALARRLFVRRSSAARVIDTPLNVMGLRRENQLIVTASPTQGFAPIGFIAPKSDGTARYLCTFSLDTATTQAEVSGATTVTLSAVAGITTGDIIGINQDDRTTHWTTVNGAPVGNVVTLTAALTANAASGSRVVLNRWRAEVT